MILQINLEVNMTEKEKQEMYKLLKSLRMSDDEIWSKINETSDLESYTPITYRELENMSDAEKDELYSYCWHDGRFRCDCVGITDVIFKKYPRAGGICETLSSSYYSLNFSNENGDPKIIFHSYDDLIDNVGDGEWNYGLYKKK